MNNVDTQGHPGGNGEAVSPQRRLIEERAIEQLRRREGLMAALSTENGTVQLDWVEGVARLLADNTLLEEVEEEAQAIWARGIRHIIWAGMGGSVVTVRVLAELGFCAGEDGEHIALYPLDSTDPAALNTLVQQIARAKNSALPAQGSALSPGEQRALFDDMMMIGVSMGMTSEEPITHLEWFTTLISQAQLSLSEHLLVITLPGSYLDRFAQVHHLPVKSVQVEEGTGLAGRMSAPTTNVFLLPLALYLTRTFHERGRVRAVLRQSWDEYALDLAVAHPVEHPFVQLAIALSRACKEGTCRLLLKMPQGSLALIPWVEQLMEQSLGKGGKGIVVFRDQDLNPHAPGYHVDDVLRVRVVTQKVVLAGEDTHSFALYQPSLANTDPQTKLAALAASFLGWQLSMALYGYLHHITIANEPAVENYKARARALRTQEDPLLALRQWHESWQAATGGGHGSWPPLALFAPQETELDGAPALVFARALHRATSIQDLGYLDCTINGELPNTLLLSTSEHLKRIGNQLLGVPMKLRRAPAEYHVSEQSEMDGPAYLVSLRILMVRHETCLLGTYTDTFLNAQAVSTWQAMNEQGRPCFLLLLDGLLPEASKTLNDFFLEVEQHLRRSGEGL